MTTVIYTNLISKAIEILKALLSSNVPMFLEGKTVNQAPDSVKQRITFCYVIALNDDTNGSFAVVIENRRKIAQPEKPLANLTTRATFCEHFQF